MTSTSRLTSGFAVTIALIALVAAIGGTSYAAARLAVNSVGTAQLKDGAVTSDKVRNRALRAVDLKKGLLRREVTKIDLSTGYGYQQAAIAIRGIGRVDLSCASNQVYMLLEKKPTAPPNSLVATGVWSRDDDPLLIGGGYENLFFSGGGRFSVSIALAQGGTPATAHLDLYGVRTGSTCRFTGQLVS